MTTRLAAMIVTLAASALPALASADQAPPTAENAAQPKCVAQSQIENGKVTDSKVTCFDTAGNVVSQDDVRVAIFDKSDDKAKLIMAQYYECDPRYYNCGYDYDYGPGYYYGGGGYGYGRGFRGGRGFGGGGFGHGFGGGHGGFGGGHGGFGGGGHGGGHH